MVLYFAGYGRCVDSPGLCDPGFSYAFISSEISCSILSGNCIFPKSSLD
jgi:hypothetical protein